MTVDLHHVIDGPADGPTVVLAGALGTDTSMWEPQVAPLVAAGFRVVRYDHRGHGRSPVPDGPYSIEDLAGDAAALLDRLGVGRVHWVGLSLGAMVGMWLAQHGAAPHKTARQCAAQHGAAQHGAARSVIDRLVLCCTSARLGPPRMWADRARLVRAEGMAPLAEAAVGRWLTTRAATGQDKGTGQDKRTGQGNDRGPGAGEDLVERLTAMFVATPAEGYAGCCAALGSMDLTPDLGRIRVPTLVIAGAEDLATPPEHARRIVYGVAGARLAVVDGAAHLGNVERPDEFTSLIIEHLLDEADPIARGTERRRAVFGDDHVDRAAAATTAFTAPFQQHITRAVWGSLWTRDGIDDRMRSAITLAVLTALRCHDELGMHVAGALRNGLTPEEIGEVLLHTSAYAGVPAARSAFAIADEVIRGNDGADLIGEDRP